MKHIIVAGASSGIGRIIATLCAEIGWKVGIVSRNEQALAALKSKYPTNIEYLPIDITNSDAPEKLNCLIELIGGMDIYFHVSGILIENPDLEIKSDIATVATNVAGFTRMIDAAFNYFRTTGRDGQIAAITSVAGTKGIADLASYSAAKRYQWTYLQALEQLARRENINIVFTDIRPGWTRTPLIDPTRKYLLAMKSERVAEKALKAIIRKRRVVVIDRKWALLYYIWRIVPSFIWTRVPLKASKG